MDPVNIEFHKEEIQNPYTRKSIFRARGIPDPAQVVTTSQVRHLPLLCFLIESPIDILRNITHYPNIVYVLT